MFTLSKRDIFLATYRHQTWSFPDSIIYHITKNPSTPKCYEKMIQSCKHFYIKNPILIVSSLSFVYEDKKWKTRVDKKPLDLKNVVCKFWITDEFTVFNEKQHQENFLSSIISRIYQSDIKRLSIFHQNISFNTLKLLASKCAKICLLSVTVMAEDDITIVPLEKIVEALTELEVLEYCANFNPLLTGITSNTVAEILKIPHFTNFTRFCLSDIPEAFDIDAFFDFIKKNKKTNIALEFSDRISKNYQDRLRKIVYEIFSTKNCKYLLPYIHFIESVDFF